MKIATSLPGVLLLNKDLELLYVDQKAVEILSESIGLRGIVPFQKFDSLWKAEAITTEKGDPISYDESPFKKALETSETQSGVVVVRMKNESRQSLYFQCKPVFQSGQVVPFSVVCYVSDLTREKEQAKSQLLTDLFLEFHKQTPDLIWIINNDTNLQFGNPAFYQYFGLNEKALNKKISEVVPKAVARALYNDHLKVILTQRPLQKEQKVRLADGTISDFLVHLFPFTSTDGQRMVGGHAVYVTNKYEIERQLIEANEQLLTLSRAVQNAIWEWDMRTGQIFRNEHLLDMIGYPIEQTKDLEWWFERIHPEDRDQLNRIVKEAMEKRQMSWEQSYRFKCSNGSYKHVVDRGFVVYENNVPIKMIGSLKDVTELRELEKSLVEERIRRQNEISETMIQVQERERMRIGMELHDNINQILTSLRLYVCMLQPNQPDESEIKDKCLDLASVAIEEIRKLSKDLVGPHLNESTLVQNIQKLIDDINGCDTVKITFTYSHEADLLSHGKKLALFRITQEQVKNILKYSKASQANICLHYKNDRVQLIIRDDGIGFNAKKTVRGVGLASIHERTRFYNGRVEIKTAEGEGCMLKIEMPVECEWN